MKKLVYSILIIASTISLFGQKVGIGIQNPDSTFHVLGNTLHNGKVNIQNTSELNKGLTIKKGGKTNSLLLYNENTNYEALKIGKNIVGSIELSNQPSIAVTSSILSSGPAWQEFRPLTTKILTNIAFDFGGISNTSRTIRIYAGSGINGAILYENNNYKPLAGWSISPPINLPIVANQAYTIWLSADNWLKKPLNANEGNTYLPGKSSMGDHDFRFRTFMINADENYRQVTSFNINGDIKTVGKIKAASLKINENPGLNKVLISDATGNSTWQTNPPTVPALWLPLQTNNIIALENIKINNPPTNARLSIAADANAFQVSGSNSQLRIRESDNSDKEWGVSVNGGQLRISETSNATTPVIIEQNNQNNALVLKNDNIVATQNLQVSELGTPIQNIVMSEFTVGPSATAVKEVTLNFGAGTFSSPPLFFPQCRNETSAISDQFAVTIKSITNTSTVIIITRLDAPTGWGQQLKLDWWALQ